MHGQKKNKFLGALLIDFLFEANYLIKNDNFAIVGIKGNKKISHIYIISAKKIEKWSTMKRNSGIFALKSLDYSLPYAIVCKSHMPPPPSSPGAAVESFDQQRL